MPISPRARFASCGGVFYLIGGDVLVEAGRLTAQFTITVLEYGMVVVYGRIGTYLDGRAVGVRWRSSRIQVCCLSSIWSMGVW